MADPVRCLNDVGIKQFSDFVASLRDGQDLAIPYQLLTSEESSLPLDNSAIVERKRFASPFEFGRYLQQALKSLDRRAISLNDALWNWLALYYFDELCPKLNGKRTVLEQAVYILERPFNHRRYYRHLVRAPWLAVSDHGAYAKVLLITSRGGTRSDISEQLGASQDIFGNPIIIAGAYKLYFDEATQRPKRGAGGKLGGSARRLTTIAKQLSLTYDIQECSPSQFLQLLPKEFDKFKAKEITAVSQQTQKSPLKNLLRRFSSSKTAPRSPNA